MMNRQIHAQAVAIASQLPQETEQPPRIERIENGGRNRVVVLHVQDGSLTFVIPAGVTDSEYFAQEASAAKGEAAIFYEKARNATTRAKFAEIAAGLCEPQAGNLTGDGPPVAAH